MDRKSEPTADRSIDEGRRRRLPASYGVVLVPLLLTFIMTFIVSGIATIKSLGLTSQVWATWPMAWLLSWVIAFPTIVVVMPLVKKLVALLVEEPPTLR